MFCVLLIAPLSVKTVQPIVSRYRNETVGDVFKPESFWFHRGVLEYGPPRNTGAWWFLDGVADDNAAAR